MSEAVVYIAIRRDLNMRRGKEIAQAAHAILGLDVPPYTPVIAVKARDLAHMREMVTEAGRQRVPAAMIHDAGLTEVPPGTPTCAAFGPVERGLLPSLAAATLY